MSGEVVVEPPEVRRDLGQRDPKRLHASPSHSARRGGRASGGGTCEARRGCIRRMLGYRPTREPCRRSSGGSIGGLAGNVSLRYGPQRRMGRRSPAGVIAPPDPWLAQRPSRDGPMLRRIGQDVSNTETSGTVRVARGGGHRLRRLQRAQRWPRPSARKPRRRRHRTDFGRAERPRPQRAASARRTHGPAVHSAAGLPGHGRRLQEPADRLYG